MKQLVCELCNYHLTYHHWEGYVHPDGHGGKRCFWNDAPEYSAKKSSSQVSSWYNMRLYKPTDGVTVISSAQSKRVLNIEQLVGPCILTWPPNCSMHASSIWPHVSCVLSLSLTTGGASLSVMAEPVLLFIVLLFIVLTCSAMTQAENA